MRNRWLRQAAATAALSALLVTAAACANNEPPDADPPADAAQQGQQNGNAEDASDGTADAEAAAQLLEEYDRLLAEAGQAKDIVAFIDDRMPEAPVEAADTMARRLLDYYEQDLTRVEQAFETADVQAALLAADWPITPESAAAIADERIRTLVEDTLRGGYKLTMAEGYIFPQVDYGAWSRHASQLTPEVADYMALRALETDQPTVADGGLIISWDELGSRALQAERYLRDYPEAEVYEDIQTLLERYMAVYLQGVDNTAIYDFESLTLLDEVKASYKKLVDEHPNSAAASVTSGYLALLDARGGQIFAGKDLASGVAPEIVSYWEGLRLQLDDLLHS